MASNRRGEDANAEPPKLSLYLLGEFALRRDGEEVPLAQGARRLVAFLALRGKWLPRGYVAGTLWGEASEQRAHGSLRSALWRLGMTGLSIIESGHDELRIHPALDVDVHRGSALAHDLLAGRFESESIEMAESGLWQELLPGWYDDWIIVEREHHHQLALLTLEALAEHCTDVGRFDTAVLAARMAIEREPLRESAHRALIRAHIAQGNVAEAIRRCRAYEQFVLHDLGIDPSPRMAELLSAPDIGIRHNH
ncbi:MAG: transcriptional regulator, family [Acidimicrobiaceae bacterium]|nr:transcriptional regulator, family [Acidimicrobiaceae bacterium]